MIFKKDEYVLVKNSFKKASKILYDDHVKTENSQGFVSDFSKPSGCFLVHTEYKSFMYHNLEKIHVRDFLTSSHHLLRATEIQLEDYLILNKVKNTYENSSFDFSEHLLNNNYDFVQEPEHLKNPYNLSKRDYQKLIVKYSPEVEQKITQDLGIDCEKIDSVISSTREEILQNNSRKILKKQLKLNKKFLDLVFIFITNNFKITSPTKLDLYLDCLERPENITEYLDNLEIPYALKENSIAVQSNFIYSLFVSSFSKLTFLLQLSQKHSTYLIDKLRNYSQLELSDKIASNYLQEFLYRHDLLYSVDYFNEVFFLTVIENFLQDIEHFFLPINLLEYKQVENLIEIIF